MNAFYNDQKGAKNYPELISTDYYILYMALIICQFLNFLHFQVLNLGFMDIINFHTCLKHLNIKSIKIFLKTDFRPGRLIETVR